MDDAKSGPVRLSFNPQLRIEFRGATVTSDAGLLLPRELDERLGLGTLIERHLTDPRTGRNFQFALPDLFRLSTYSRLAGYEDTNDAERLAHDPAFRMLASRERRETSVALTSTLHWFETEVLAEERNYQGLARLNTDLQPARDGRAVDQGGQRSHPLDPPLLSSLPGQRRPAALGRHRVQPRKSAASARPACRHPGLVPDESPAAALQDRRAADPACAVLRAPVGRELLDREPLSPDSRAYRATRVAPDVIWSTARGAGP
jgi:hypothetical protein